MIFDEITIAAAVIFFLYGAVFGSFINVVIYRVPRGKSLVKGRSACTSCGAFIKPYDLVPILSWAILRGRCRNCGEKISPRYPAVEFVCAALCGVTPLFFSIPFAVLFSILFLTLTAIFFIDFDNRIIPDSLNVTIALLAVAAFFLRQTDVLPYFIGLAAGGVPVFLLAVFTGGFGMGDVKLLAALGLLMGWKLALVVMFLSFVTGAAVGVGGLALKKFTRKTKVPFGPFICVSAVFASFFGDWLVGLYTSFFLGF